MSEEVKPQQVLKDPWPTKPEKVWLLLSNVTDRGKFKVSLEVNGTERVIFNTYVHQNDGVISESHNLTWMIAAKDKQLEDLREWESRWSKKCQRQQDEIARLKEELEQYKFFDGAHYYKQQECRIAKLEAALREIAESRDCGCKPVCQCLSEESMRIELSAIRDIAREAIASKVDGK